MFGVFGAIGFCDETLTQISISLVSIYIFWSNKNFFQETFIWFNHLHYFMLTLEEITIKLQDRRLKEVSRRSEVGYITVWRIAKNCAGNVSYESIKKLSDYLESTA